MRMYTMLLNDTAVLPYELRGGMAGRRSCILT
jgi:hypothetical protein